MTGSVKNRVRPYFLAAAIACPAAAQDFEIGEIPKPKDPPKVWLTEVTAGLGYQSDDSFFLGRYGGVTDKGMYGFIDGAFRGRGDWDSGQTTFWDARTLVANRNRYVASAAYGEQGVWRISGFVDAFTRFQTESARTIFEGAGTNNLNLPSSWTGGASALLLAGLRNPLNPIELKTDWRTIGGDAIYAPVPGYELRISAMHRDRDGLRANGLAFGPEANFPSGTFFPMPVNYRTNRVSAALTFADRGITWNLRYEFHRFDEENEFVLVQNPFSRSVGAPWPGGAFAGFPISFAQYSTPPDSVAHRFSAGGTWTVAPRTRLTARVSHTIQKQNEPFLPYSPVAQLVVIDPVPRASLDGKIKKTFANIALTSREWDSVDLAASYTYDDRDNLTPIDLYNYIPGDSQDQARPFIAGVSRYIRFNLPHSFKFQKIRAEAGYRPAQGTRISLAYTGDFKDRDYQQVAESNEHSIVVKALTTFERASGWVSAAYIRRGGSDYIDDVAWNASHTTSYLNAGPQNRSIEYPLLFKYYLVDRKRNEYKAGVTFDASDALTFSASGGHARDRYHKSLFGLRRSESMIANADAAYVIRDVLTVSAFYSYERYTFDQKGYYITSQNLNNPQQEWTANSRDTARTGGAQVDWQAVPDQTKLTASYVISDGAANTDVQATGFTLLARVAPLPEVAQRTQQASVGLEHAFKPDLAVRIGYAWEKHTTRDWAYDNVAIAPVSQLIGSGIVSPRYSAHIVTVATRVRY